jgi:hypothetical protein
MSSQWSHAAVAIDQGTMGGYLMETTDLEISVGLFSRYLEDENVSVAVFRCETLSYSDIIKIREQSKKLEGKIYGYLQLVSLGIRRLLMRVGIKIPNLIKLGTICNQVVTLAYAGINKDPFTKLDPKGVDTDELFQALLESKDFKLIFQKLKKQK